MESKYDYAIFILTHGRADNVKTKKTLDRCGYTGKIYYIVDDEDKDLPKYIDNFGEENVKVFNKDKIAKKFDEGNNFGYRNVIIHARNACWDIAKELGIKNFVQFDDDYYYFGYRGVDGAVKISDIDPVFDYFFEFLHNTQVKTIAFSQGGDHIGGFSGVKMKRKAMNSFFCTTDKPFTFVGSINEDVNTYASLTAKGDIFFTFTGVQLDQKDTQSQKGGMTGEYLLNGTYIKSFHTVMMQPSSVKVFVMNSRNTPRLHHRVNWRTTAPVILSEDYKK